MVKKRVKIKKRNFSKSDKIYSKLKGSIAELKESELKFRILFESSRDAIMTLEPPKWKFTSGNHATVKMFDVKSEGKFISLGPWEVSPKYQPDGQLSSVKAKKMINKAMNKGSNFFEWTHKRYKGENFPATVLLTRTKIKGKTALQATVRDITKEKENEEDLIESEKRYRTIFEGAGDGILAADPKTRKFLFANEMFCKLSGYSKKEIPKLGIRDITLKKDLPYVTTQFKKHIKQKTVITRNLPILKKNKEVIYCDIGSYKIIINGKNVLLGFFRDVTKEREAEEELRKSSFYLNAMGDAVITIDTNLKITSVNNAFSKLWGYSTKELKNKGVLSLFTKKEGLKQKKEMMKAAKTGEISRFETAALTKNKKEIPVYITGSMLEDKGGKLIGFIAVFKDISKQKKVELELLRSREKLALFNVRLENKIKERTKELEAEKDKTSELLTKKTEFFNHLSHDIRGPLTPIIAMASVLEMDNVDEDKRKIISVIQRNAKYLKTLVKNTLDISKLELSKGGMNFVSVNMHNLIEESIKFNSPSFYQKNIKIKNNVDKNLIIKCDKFRMREVIQNLLINSIKFTSMDGRVVFGSKKHNKSICIYIKDNGIGMTKKEIKYIFDEFYIADESRHGPSSGLGLSISKKIVEKHGGEMWAESKGKRKGSTFFILLPKNPEKKVKFNNEYVQNNQKRC